jgi:uncharacterized protein (AIM24 family)
MSSPLAPGSYFCQFCRLPSDAASISCPNCGAPVDVRAHVSDSGWTEQPPARDMARIQFGRSTCQIEGTIVPTADMSLVDTDSVYFSHHVLLWMEPSVTMSPMPMKGGWNRMLAGMPLIMMQAHGPGHVAFSEDAPGELVVIPLQQGQEVDVREHRFLVAGANVTYDWFQSNIWYTTRSGNDSETHYPLGRFVDRFRAESGPGLLLLHSPGNTFVRDLNAGEAICIQPSALLYKDPGVGMMLHFEYPNARGMSWGGNYTSRTVWLRLWGPGRVALQSVFERPESGRTISRHSEATQTQW